MDRYLIPLVLVLGLVPILGFTNQSESSDSMIAQDQVTLRVPGMAESFTLARCPKGTVQDPESEESIKIPELYVLTTELTWDLYDIFVYKLDEPEENSPADAITRPSKPYVPPDRGFGHDGYPAIGMTRHAAEAFCEWLSVKTGLSIRLPNAHEWSYLANADLTDSCCSKPEEPLDTIAWFDQNAEHTTHPVASKKPNAFGLFDMHGIAAEWVMTDTRKPYAYGGSFRDSAEECTPTSSQRQNSRWNQSDPQIPKSQWWLADCTWVGFRFVIETESIDQDQLKDLLHDEHESE